MDVSLESNQPRTGLHPMDKIQNNTSMAEYVEQKAIKIQTTQTSPVPNQCKRISFPPLDLIQSNPKNKSIPPEKVIQDLRMLPKKCTSNNPWSGKSPKHPIATPNK